jgi:hypothetical protein
MKFGMNTLQPSTWIHGTPAWGKPARTPTAAVLARQRLQYLQLGKVQLRRSQLASRWFAITRRWRNTPHQQQRGAKSP